ncbi:MAG: hypothetical protein ABRQ30_03955 [Smithellaceae bacterium]|jgi:hypothetical protein
MDEAKWFHPFLPNENNLSSRNISQPVRPCRLTVGMILAGKLRLFVMKINKRDDPQAVHDCRREDLNTMAWGDI